MFHVRTNALFLCPFLFFLVVILPAIFSIFWIWGEWKTISIYCWYLWKRVKKHTNKHTHKKFVCELSDNWAHSLLVHWPYVAVHYIDYNLIQAMEHSMHLVSTTMCAQPRERERERAFFMVWKQKKRTKLEIQFKRQMNLLNRSFVFDLKFFFLL